MQEDRTFDEFEQSKDKFNGILVIIIEKAEMIEDPGFELGDEINACQSSDEDEDGGVLNACSHSEGYI